MPWRTLAILGLTAGCASGELETPADPPFELEDESSSDDASDPAAGESEPPDTTGPGEPEPEEPDQPEPAGDSESGEPIPEPGESDSADEPDEPCSGAPRDIVPEGWAEASSTFETWLSSYPPERALDGDFGTSWFSAGPQDDGTPTRFTFATTTDHCIDKVTFYGNEVNDNANFRSGYGFDAVTIRIFDTADSENYALSVDLDGTPDPNFYFNPYVVGHRIELEFQGHEALDCGGFSELMVVGRDLL